MQCNGTIFLNQRKKKLTLVLMISATRRSLLKTSHSGTGPASAGTPEGAASIPPPVATDAARERASSSSSSTRTAALRAAK